MIQGFVQNYDHTGTMTYTIMAKSFEVLDCDLNKENRKKLIVDYNLSKEPRFLETCSLYCEGVKPVAFLKWVER